VINQNIGGGGGATPFNFAGGVSQLANMSTSGSDLATQAGQGLLGLGGTNPITSGPLAQNLSSAQSDLQKLQSDIAAYYSSLGQSSLPLYAQQGKKSVVATQFAQQLDAAQQRVVSAQQAMQNAISAQTTQQTGFQQAGQIGTTAQQLAQGGLGSAVSAAAPAQNYPFVFNPLTGSYTNQSGSGGGMVTPQQAAQAVNSGTMTPDQAKSALAYMGTSADSQLYSAMQGINPSFNWNQAAQNAQIQGTIGPQSNLATAVLGKLQTALTNVPGWQNTGNNVLNALGALVNNSGLFGSGVQQSSQSVGNLIREARLAVSNALGTAYHTTPTDFDSMVHTWFPDNITAAQVTAGMQDFSALMSSRSESFSSPGTVPLPTGGGGITGGQIVQTTAGPINTGF
jgi:hypothetical protein